MPKRLCTKAPAPLESPIRKLDDNSLRKVLLFIPPGEHYVFRVACKWFRSAYGKETPVTTAAGLFSSIERLKDVLQGIFRRWYINQRPDLPPWIGWTPDMTKMMASSGSLACLQWARRPANEWDDCDRHFIFVYLGAVRSDPCPWDEETCSFAARGGHLDVLQWARANECPWDEDTCSSAARGGHLKVLQWARAKGCLWDKATCHYAAERSHFKVLQWARANGCPWDKYVCLSAASGGHLEMLQWARRRTAPGTRKCAYVQQQEKDTSTCLSGREPTA